MQHAGSSLIPHNHQPRSSPVRETQASRFASTASRSSTYQSNATESRSPADSNSAQSGEPSFASRNANPSNPNSRLPIASRPPSLRGSTNEGNVTFPTAQIPVCSVSPSGKGFRILRNQFEPQLTRLPAQSLRRHRSQLGIAEVRRAIPCR